MLIWLLIITAVAVGLTYRPSKNTKTVLRIAHNLDTSHPLHKSIQYFAKQLDSESNGQIQAYIYPNGQLGADREAIEQLQSGVLSMSICSCGPLESFIPEMQVFGVPYLFRSKQHMLKTLNSDIGNELLRSGEKFGLKGLCFFDAGARSFYTRNTPIHCPADLEGLKIRVMKTNMSIRTIKALNGSPTPIDFGELYTALQQGVVDGAENNPPSFYSSMHFELCRYYSLDEHLRIPDMLLISNIFWNRLTAKQQDIITETAQKCAQYQYELWAQKETATLQKVQEAGVEIIHPNKKPFIQAVQPLWKSFDGTWTGNMITKIQTINCTEK
ncbi:MAG: DctP family TRAP transporter solute-binding subunit [Chitinivibrionales bacterium]|nr:DctP family TRAP transporter solute-binding subunit [Chitinivibrionales bacterium]